MWNASISRGLARGNIIIANQMADAAVNLLGNVSVLTNVTLTQLLEEASVRWPSLWFDEEPRTTCLVMLARKSRPEMEHHGFFVEHLHPVFGLFYRPRDEAATLKARGFDPLSASFQFLNLAVSDLGLWMQKLTEEQDFEQTSVMIEPLPSSASSSLRLGFEAFQLTTYRHRSLSELTRLPLAMPPLSLVSKAFLSIPESPPPVDALHIPTQPESPAEETVSVETDQASADVHEVEAAPVVEPSPPAEVEATEVAPAEPAVEATTEIAAEPIDEGPAVAVIPIEVISDVAAEEPAAHVIMDEGTIPAPAPSTPSPPASPATHEIVAEQSDLPSEGIESEFRMIVQRLMAEGLDHNTIMEDPEFQEISDRALATGINTWQLFLKIAT